MSTARVSLTARDHLLVHAAWSFGWVTSPTLTQLVSPGTSVKTLAGRLSQLAAAGYLRRRHVPAGPGAHVWLYGAGRNAASIDPAFRDAWRPPDAQLAHTLAVSATIAALIRPGALGRIDVTAWQGEAELRTWHEAGAPLPDLRLRWRLGDESGTWAIEVDRGTEARGAWRRKLVRYLHTRNHVPLIVTTSDERARNIARLARDLGVAALTTDRHTLAIAPPLHVYDARSGRRRAVDQAAP